MYFNDGSVANPRFLLCIFGEKYESAKYSIHHDWFAILKPQLQSNQIFSWFTISENLRTAELTERYIGLLVYWYSETVLFWLGWSIANTCIKPAVLRVEGLLQASLWCWAKSNIGHDWIVPQVSDSLRKLKSRPKLTCPLQSDLFTFRTNWSSATTSQHGQARVIGSRWSQGSCWDKFSVWWKLLQCSAHWGSSRGTIKDRWMPTAPYPELGSSAVSYQHPVSKFQVTAVFLGIRSVGSL